MLQSISKNAFCFAVSLCVLALASTSRADTCTPTTCPPGPVIAVYQYNNCTGYVIYIPSPFPFGCTNSSAQTSIWVNTADYAEGRTIYGYGGCDENAIPAGTRINGNRFYYGVCGPLILRKRDATEGLDALSAEMIANDLEGFDTQNSMMFLADVNASHEAQPYPTYRPEFPNYQDALVSQACYSPNNCTFPEGVAPILISNQYTSDTCGEIDASDMTANITSGQCYNHNSAYIRFHCLDGHTLASDTMVGNCDRVYTTQFSSVTCGSYINSETTCTAKPLGETSPSAPVPASPAVSSFSHTSSLLLSLLCIVILAISVPLI